MNKLLAVLLCAVLLGACSNQSRETSAKAPIAPPEPRALAAENVEPPREETAVVEPRPAVKPSPVADSAVPAALEASADAMVSQSAPPPSAVEREERRAKEERIAELSPSPRAAGLVSANSAKRMDSRRERPLLAPSLAAPQAMRDHPRIAPEVNRERYGTHDDNPVKLVAQEPVSTFSVDVDTGSYANVRRMLSHGQLPPKDAVRVEEMINYFPYHYALPQDGKPFAVHTALAPAPWNAERVLLRVALKGADIAKQTLPPANLVFLVDVSGSMDSDDKLPLLRSSLKLLVDQLREQDRISLVTYAGTTAVVLSGTPGSEKKKIAAAIDQLGAGGSTAGGAGIQLAYQQAQEHFIKGGINRILLATDGDFNVGITDFAQLKQMIEEKRKSGVSFTTLGFGSGNYNEQLMEQLADAGNGAYSYIDSLMEGKKVLVNEMTSTLATIAKDVKIQVEFNPQWVTEYRLIGYENRVLRREDFNNDKVDAGDIGAGHTVTALYELTLTGQKGALDPLRYQAQEAQKPAAPTQSDELAFIKLRYKKPDGEQSILIEQPIARAALQSLAQADDDFRLAAAVAGFGQLLRGTANLGTWNYKDARALAAESTSRQAAHGDEYGYRGELVKLIEVAGALTPGGE